ncbi:MAG: BamA/TamA family outer membrane protein [Imperialibacter sp.]|uniref:BamA/TamA family outer membrane protein n=1 Tax=Imperialibacter sp. TaxID=2038411 RepID=UPI0032EF01AA
MPLRTVGFWIVWLMGWHSLYAQTADTTSIQDSTRNRIYGLPVAFYTPETKLAFGVAGVYAFRIANDTADSQVQALAIYTLNKQLLLYAPFQLRWHQNQYYSYGEVGYYRYVYQFYGIGNPAPLEALEFYEVNFPRIRLNLLRRVRPNLYAGLRYWFESYKIVKTDPDGRLANEAITGNRGGLTSSPGLVLIYDSRNNIFFPGSGWYIETLVQHDNRWTGSDFRYTTVSVDASTYFTTPWKHVVALNGYAVMQQGEPPFHLLAMLGGSKKLRGYFEGRFRDKNLMLLQAAYRAPLFWRIGAVAFVGYGGVAPQIQAFSLDNFKLAGGAGLRFVLDQEKKINIRIDAGFGKGTSGYYLTIGEAF